MLKRRDLPNYLELPYQFDIKKMQDSCAELMKLDWNALESEYKDLLELYKYTLAPNFDIYNEDKGYMQFSFTEYDGTGDPTQEYFYSKRNEHCVGIWKEIMDTFKGQVTRVRLARMLPNTKIEAHIDYDTTYSIRVQVPVFTNKDVFFYTQRVGEDVIEKLHMPANGSCWFSNPGMLHWVENNGLTDRIHLIVSIKGQEDLENLISP